MVFVNELVASLLIAVVQGITEWLPISSSGHLVLFEKLLGSSGGLQFDVALHFGTLAAVFVYFGSDIIEIIRDFVRGRWESENGKTGWMIIIATIPAALVGYFMKNIFEMIFSSLGFAAMGFAVSGLFLVIVSVSGKKILVSYSPPTLPNRGNQKYGKEDQRYVKGEESVGRFSYLGAFLVGCAQIFALFPGISRSGSTIGAGMLLGLSDKAAIRFSFLMSIPIIFGANFLTIGNDTLPPNLIWATLVSFLVGLITIHLLYGRMLASRKSLKWYGFYALIVAIILGIFTLV